MKYQELMDILNEVTEDVRIETIVIRLQWWANNLYLTYWQGDLLIQRAIECKTPQKVNYWEIHLDFQGFFYGLYIPSTPEDLLMEFLYDPETKGITVSAEANSRIYTGTIYGVSDYKADFYLPPLDFLEEPSDGQAILSRNEWRKLESAVCIARQVEAAEIYLEAIADTIYVNVHGCCVAAYYCLNTKAEDSLRESIPFPFEAIDYINTKCQNLNYVRLEFYSEWVMIQAGGNIRIFLEKCFFKKGKERRAEQPDTNVKVRVKRLELIAALKEVSIDIRPQTPDAQRASLFLTSPNSLFVEGCSERTRLQVEAVGENQDQMARIIVWSKELAEILEFIPDPTVNILIPTHPFEPMVIHSVGILIFYAGFYEEIRIERDPKDYIKDFYEREQSDGSILQVSGIEQSPLEPYESLDMKRKYDEELHDERRRIFRTGIIFDWAVSDYHKVRCIADRVAGEAEEMLKSMKASPNYCQFKFKELDYRLNELKKQIESGLAFEVYDEDEDEERYGDERTPGGESMMVSEVWNSTNIVRIHAGRVWSVLENKPRLYRLTLWFKFPPPRITSEPETTQALLHLAEETIQTLQKLAN